MSVEGETHPGAPGDVKQELLELRRENAALRAELKQLNDKNFKTAEAELRQTREDMRAILDAVPILISLKDRGGRYRYLNKPMADLFEASVSEVIGMRASDLLSADAGARIASFDARVLKGETIPLYEHRQTIRGRNFDFLVTKVPLRNTDGVAESVATIMVNLTDQKKMARELRES